MLCRKRLFALVVVVAFATVENIAGPQEDNVKLTLGVRPALGAIFADEHVEHEALRIHDRAMMLDEEARFELLSKWVLPSDDHHTLRMQCEFTQTCPAPIFERSQAVASKLPGMQHGQVTGGDLVSPVMDLVEVAKRLDRLDEIQSVVAQWKATSAEEHKSRIVFKLLIAIAEKDAASAELQMREILTLATSSPGSAREPHTEAVAVWAGGELEATRELARELALLLHQTAWAGAPPRNERWLRQIIGKQFRLEESLASGKPLHEVASQQLALKSWVPVSRMTSETRGTGFPHAVWKVKPGLATHLAGHHDDYLYFASPLTGNFSVEADLTTFEYRDIQLAFGGYWAGPRFDLKSCVNSSFRSGGEPIPIAPPLTRTMDSMRVRMKIDRNHTTFVNGRKIYQRPREENDDPWLSIHSNWFTHGSVTNLRVLGEPVIPDEVTLITRDLAGWVAYFDESIGGQDADWFAKDAFESGGTEAAGSRELVGRHRPDREGTFSQSLLRYHRPMIEDGTIEYEFFYQPGQTLVHPTLDRLSLILNPASVDVHWITDGRHDFTSLGPDNVSADLQHQKHRGSLPFKRNAWNALALMVRGDTVDVSLNGTLIFSRELEHTNLRMFGLFHYADQTEARVRNLRWRGNWPKTLPEPVKQELATNDLEELLGASETLPLVFEHDFRNGVPSGLFSVVGDKWEENVKQVANGIQLNRPGGEYVNYTIVSPVQLSGDFDITTSFADFENQTEIKGGESSIQLAVTLDDDRSRECFLFRKVYGVHPEARDQLVQAAIFEKRGGETQYNFFSNPAEESSSGRMRIVRRGIKLSFLYAENESTEFRLIHSETVSGADATVKLVVGQHKAGFAKVVWKNLTVRAQSAFGAPEVAVKTIVEFDKERAALADERVYNFGSPKSVAGTEDLKGFAVWNYASATYARDKAGLTITVPGSENWQAAGLVAKVSIAGDFDISLELDVLHMEPCKKFDESVVLLQAEFNDVRKSNSEVKFSIHNGGDTKAETQQRRIRGDGTFNYQEIVSRPAETASLLRLARRGDVVYQIFRGKPDAPPEVLGAMKIGTDPVPLGMLRALIHTGGENRKSVIRFKAIRIRAEQIVDG